MFFNKKEKLTNHVSKIDKLVTGLIIWGAVASIIGLHKKNKKKGIADNLTAEWEKIIKEWEKIVQEWTKMARKWYSCFWRVLVWILRLFSKNKKDDEK